MLTMEYYIEILLEKLKESKIKKLIYCDSIENSSFIQKAIKGNFECYKYSDARSVAYIGTGMSAELCVPVVIVSDGNNESRSLFPGITEAFYRGLPIIAVVISNNDKLDWSLFFKDTVKAFFSISCQNSKRKTIDMIDKLLYGEKPCFFEIDCTEECEYLEKQELKYNYYKKYNADDLLKNLSQYLDESASLYIGNDIQFDNIDFKCKVVMNRGVSGNYGTLSMTLGASLCKQRSKYIGLVTENEFFHEMNTLGNKCMNNKVVYIVIVEKEEKLIIDYAKNLNFNYITYEKIGDIIKCTDKPILATFLLNQSSIV